MKQFFTLALFLCAVVAFGQTYDVTFTVNMANETTSPDGVFLAGGGNFGNPGDNPMTDADADDVWEITMTLDAGFSSYYTFTNGICPDWSCKENLAGQPCGDPANFNDRWLPEVMADQTIQHCFAQCTTDGTCEDVGGPVDVTFKVDMNDETVLGSIYISGASIDGWCGTCEEMFDDDADGVYEVTLSMDQGAHEYKYTNAGWDNGEIFDPVEDAECTLTTGDFTNRFLMIDSADPIVLDAMCFNSCGECSGVVTTAEVTFQVDMSAEASAGPVFITGNSIDGWCGTCVEMFDDDADGVYTVTLTLGQGPHEFKYNNVDWDGTETLDETEDAACTLTTDGFTNRLIEIDGTDPVEMDVVCFGACTACLPDAINSIQDSQFSMFPSVTSDQVTIVFAQSMTQNRNLKIYNAATQLVENINVGNQSSQITLDVANYAAGLYMVAVEANGSTEIKKLVVTK